MKNLEAVNVEWYITSIHSVVVALSASLVMFSCVYRPVMYPITSCGILRFHNCRSSALPERLFSKSLEDIQGQNLLKGQEVIITASNISEDQLTIHY